MKTAPFLAVSKNTRPMALCVRAVPLRAARCEIHDYAKCYILGNAVVRAWDHSQVYSDRKTWDRFAPAAGLYVGKWFSPIIALRIGANYMTLKGLSDIRTEDCKLDEPLVEGKYKQKFNHRAERRISRIAHGCRA